MAQLDILDIFEDCINRLSEGQSIEECLRVYPGYADRLRPILETTQTVQTMELVPVAEQNEDIPIIWDIIQREKANRIPLAVLPRHRSRPNIRTQLLIAIILLMLLTLTTWFLLSRPDLPNVTVPIVETMTHTATSSSTPSETATLTPTASTTTPSVTRTNSPTVTATFSPSPTYTATLTMTNSPTPTQTQTPSETPLPTATYVPGCGAPASSTDASNIVKELYPNTTIVSVEQTTRFGDRLIWEIETSHGIEVTVDVGCGNILTIEQDNNTPTDTTNNNINSNTNVNTGSGSNTTTTSSNSGDNDSSNASGSSDNDNDNSNDNNDNDSNNNSNDNNDDNSGMGSDDDDDDNSGMGSGD